MKNQQIIKLFLVLFLSTISIFSISHFGAKAYQSATTNNDVFAEGTMIGSLSVAGLTANEAITLVNEELSKWIAETTYIIKYREASENFDLKYFTFDVEQSVLQAVDGLRNPIRVTLEPIDEVLFSLSSSLTPSMFHMEDLKAELLNNAAVLKAGNYEIRIDDFLKDEAGKTVTIAETIIENELLASAFHKKSIEIQPKEHFSLLDFVEEHDDFPSVSLSKLASAIYKVILPTNFSIIERHISSELPNYAELGYEAKIDQERNLDLVFYNPNDFNYFIQFENINNQLSVSLTGPEFTTKYVLVTEDEERFAPKVIRQFNPQLGPTEVKVKLEGKMGQIIKVYREHRNEQGKVIKKEFISEDFYPPVHQIEVQGLISNEIEPEVEQEEDVAESSGSIDNEMREAMEVYDQLPESMQQLIEEMMKEQLKNSFDEILEQESEIEQIE